MPAIKLLLACAVLAGCQSASEAYLIGSSKAMRTEFQNGAIVRAEMRARGEVPWSSWPWAGRP